MDKELKQMIRTRYGQEHILFHGQRVAELSIQLSEISGIAINKDNLLTAAKYHDIGKTLVPRTILEKKGKLFEYEMEIIKMHPSYSYRILNTNNFEEEINIMALYHHEDFDGTGYAFCLKGKEIPIGARIIRICDSFDAITSDRPYQKKCSYFEALEIMDLSRSKYDPELYDNFKNYMLKKERIYA